MGALLDRLHALAAQRSDLVLTRTDEIDHRGFVLFRDGAWRGYLKSDAREYRQSMALAEILAGYALARRKVRRGEPREAFAALSRREALARERADRAFTVRFVRRLLWFIRAGLHGPAASRPRRGGAPGGRLGGRGIRAS